MNERQIADSLSMLRALVEEGRYSEDVLNPMERLALAQKFTARELSLLPTPPGDPKHFRWAARRSLATGKIVVARMSEPAPRERPKLQLVR